MSRGPISGDIYSLLMAQGLGAGDRVGARKQARKKRRSLAAPANKGAGVGDMRDGQLSETVRDMTSELPTGAEGGQRGPIWLAWDNPMAMRQTTRRRTGVVSLMVIDGGRA